MGEVSFDGAVGDEEGLGDLAVGEHLGGEFGDATSSKRTRPGNTGRPAASAEVQPRGRCSSFNKSHTAPESAFQLPFDCR